MSAALFIVLDQEIPNFDPFVNGKCLATESDRLDQIAAELGVEPLMEFFSASIEEVSNFLDSVDVEEEPDIELREESWFDPEDGLVTVRALLLYLREKTDAVKNCEGVICDLRKFEQVLLEARDHGAKWHLSVDF